MSTEEEVKTEFLEKLEGLKGFQESLKNGPLYEYAPDIEWAISELRQYRSLCERLSALVTELREEEKKNQLLQSLDLIADKWKIEIEELEEKISRLNQTEDEVCCHPVSFQERRLSDLQYRLEQLLGVIR